jgi:hypothetical protein
MGLPLPDLGEIRTLAMETGMHPMELLELQMQQKMIEKLQARN